MRDYARADKQGTMGAVVHPRLTDPKRLAAVYRLGVLDSDPEEVFDRLTRIAASIVGAPIALCTIIAPDRQFFKSSFGLPEPFASVRQTPLTHSFCQHVVTGMRPLIVPNAVEDPRLKNSRAVTEFHISSYAGMPLLSADGEAIGSFCVIDVKPREWTTKEIEILSELADIVMREFQLRDLTRQLLVEQKVKKELTDALVGDLAEPLDRITFVAQTADPMGGLSPQAVEEVVLDTQHLQMKLNDILDVARLDVGMLQPVLAPTNLEMLVHVVIAQLYDSAHERALRLEVSIPESLPYVMADEPMLARVLQNMVRHAFRFTDVGSLVFVEASEVGDEIRCSVSDTGLGLSEEIRSRIFAGALPRIASGDDIPYSALGLTYSRAAIEAMGGTMGVFSQEHVGTTLWFTLPREKAEETQPV
jgi:signal transduction histidine kinase